MLTATVTVNLSNDADDRQDRQALMHLAAVPDGARLVVVVGRRTLLTRDAVRSLADHEPRLHVDIDAADPWTARRWYDAIRTREVV